MARPVTYDSEDLLASARETFLEVGPSASTQLLAKRAQVSEGTLFKRFRNKKNLFLQAIKLPPIEDEPWFRDMIRMGAELPLEEVLVRAGLGVQDHIARAFPCIQMLMAYPDLSPKDHLVALGESNPLPLALKRRFRQLFEAQIAAGRIPEGDAYAMACFFVGALTNDAHHRLILELRDEESDAESFVRRLARSFVQMVGGNIDRAESR